MSFFPASDSNNTAVPPPAAQNPFVERDETVGLFPGEFGTPVSIPGAHFVFEDLAIAFDQFLGFGPGFFITMRVLHRAPRLDSHDRELTESLFHPPDTLTDHKRFMWGIRWSDGRKGYGVPLDAGDADFAIVGQGGGGDGVMATYHFWVHATPGPEMTIYIAWPARSIDETSITIDTSPLVAACQNNTEIARW